MPYRVEKPSAGRRKVLAERKCRSCGAGLSAGLTRHHLVRKGSPHFGPDLEANLIPLCRQCHTNFHGSPRWAEVGRSIRRTLSADEIACVVDWAGEAYLDRYYPAEDD